MNVSGVLGPILNTLMLWKIIGSKFGVNLEQKHYRIELSERILAINR